MQDRLVTVFGGSGFLGRYVVQALLKGGARVRIAARDPRDGWYLKSQGGLGQTQFVAADIRKPAAVLRALGGAHAAVNLVGILKGDYNGFHVDGAHHIAEAAVREGLASLVHISAIGADASSLAAYGRSKAHGEEVVRQTFSNATILRPSIVFGREDSFVNRFADLIAKLPIVPVIGGSTKFQPVYVGDVARAVACSLADPVKHGGRTYELGGPEVISMTALNKWIAQATGHRRRFIEMPGGISGALASATGWLPGAPITRDQWLMLQSDNVVADASRGLGALGIVPTPLEAVAEGWLVRYRPHGRFASKTA